MAVSDTQGDRPTASAAGGEAAPDRPRFGRGPRAVGILAALLAVAVAVPVGVGLTEPEPSAQPTRSRAAGNGHVDAAEAVRRAKKTGRPVEVTQSRAANITVWAQPSGRLKAEIHSSAIRAKSGADWKPIDTRLRQAEDGFAPRAVNGGLLFSAGAKTPSTRLVRLTTEGHTMTVTWPGSLPTPVVDGSRALYENVRPGIDLVLTAQDGGYAHVLVVKDRKAAADPLLGALDYHLASPTLKFGLDRASGALSARDAKGKEIAGAGSPLMWDSSGTLAANGGERGSEPPAPSRRHATLGLAGLGGAEGARTSVAEAALKGGVLTLKADRRLLDSPETKYPVFIDPSFKGHKHSWAHLYKTLGNNSFYNGQNFNEGTNEARVGYESTTGGTSRAIFNFYFGSELHGAGIKSARVRALQTYAWSCNKRVMDIYSTPFAESSSTWNNTTGWWGKKVASEDAAYGYNSSCPDNWIAPDIKGLVTEAANARWGALSLGFKAPNESDPYYWKKFLANGESAPYLEIEYNKIPDIPVAANMSTSPGGACLTSGNGTSIGKTDLTFQVKGTDPDGNLKQVQIEIWDAASGTNVHNEWLWPNSDGVVTKQLPWDRFTSGRKYYWLSRTIDWDGWWSGGSGPLDSGGGGWCTFTVDHTAPASPAVRSAHFPAPGPDGEVWSLEPAGTPNQWIEVMGNGTKAEDIREFQWSLNHPLYDQKTWVWNTELALGSINLKVDIAGPNVLYVRTVNKAGNISQPTTYLFYVRPRPGMDKPGDVTGDGFPDILAIDGTGNLRTYAGDATGDTDAWLPGAVDDGRPAPDGYWKDGSGKPALISHSTDWFPGDGVTDLVARMPDGKLYVYPGDGAGRFDIARRMEILLPTGAPNPADLTQLVTTEDVTGDGLPDAFARAGDAFWAFTGYTGASFAEAKLMSATGWSQRDIVGVRDISGDKVPDLLFRDDTDPNRTLALRKGKPGPTGGADLGSLASAAAAADGRDNTYATTGWGRAAIPMVLGTPDASGDGIPDIWAVNTVGHQYLMRGGTTQWLGDASGRDEDDWHKFLTIG
ncbi:DNRLRE domain-containing protein [Streptomyces sp. NPDC101115]|uniref:DNRLRE domain-containing protein n=1 Tax=Streptomyces sp. NPDC101115 TaxID=3366106 RepID=UPI003807E87C